MEGYDRGKKGKGWQCYNSYGDTKDNGLDKFRSDVIETSIIKLKNKRKALDVGCGNGRHSSMLSEVFDSVIGIDVSYPFDSRFNGENIIKKILWTLPKLNLI